MTACWSGRLYLIRDCVYTSGKPAQATLGPDRRQLAAVAGGPVCLDRHVDGGRHIPRRSKLDTMPASRERQSPLRPVGLLNRTHIETVHIDLCGRWSNLESKRAAW